MNISEFCIRRPVATILMSIALILGGLFAYSHLPVAALPRTEFPVINVSAQLPGASPETMANSVATPLIKQFATIAGIDAISTTSAQGSTSIAIQFVLERDIDAAAADVQAAITRTSRQLPDEMTNAPSFRKVNPADAPILMMTVRSDRVPLSELDAYSQQVISPALSTIPGVAQVIVWGSQKYAVRIQIDPNALATRGIGVDEIQTAVAAANANTPVGTLQNDKQQLIIEAKTQLENAKQFANIIVATRNGRPVRLGDVANVIDSVENTKTAASFNGERTIMLAVQRQPDANTVEVVDRVKALLPQFEATLPPGSKIGIANDRSTSIREAVEDVQFTLALTIVLVILVIFIFLRHATATIIPSFAVPISLIATYGVMYLFGFSIDNISLLALTLSVGLVVDDAIVMLENIMRHMEEEGRSPMEAALVGSKEIGFTIISITVSLLAVFIPVLLMEGIIGRLFYEFAIVVTASIAASAFVSLTLTPMLCSRIITHNAAKQVDAQGKGFNAALERGFNKTLEWYDRGLEICLKHQRAVVAVFFGTLVANFLMFAYIPKGFVPQEDIGILSISTKARQDVSFDAMSKLQKQVENVFLESPYVDTFISMVGGGGGSSGMNTGSGFSVLKPKGERPPMNAILTEFRAKFAKIAGIDVYMNPVQNLNISGGRSSSSMYQYVLQGLNYTDLYEWAPRVTEKMRADRANFVDVVSDLQNNALQATLVIDKDKAKTLGIEADRLRSTLYSGFGTRQISTIYSTGDSYSVLMEFDPNMDWSANRLDLIYVRSTYGNLVPLSAFAKVERSVGTVTVSQLGQLPAVTISFNLPEGVSLGTAVNRLEAMKQEMGLPVTITSTFSGTAKTFQSSQSNQIMLVIAAILTVYIVLGILYESFIHPLTILSGLPSAVIGALGSLLLFGMDLSIIAIIGLLMLIGIVKKNAIMMIDVALTLQRDGVEPREAIHKACLMRFRPIMMTTFAAIMGTFPIAIGHGASSELRQPLGVAVVGGLIVSQMLTLFITPVLYLYMERFSQFLLSLPERWKTFRQTKHHSA
ncbi:efflux RND transporter permease subunit [Microvirga sp. W0021]|uniref:Efflux RND transporter permease subunit n=1 Tax=Hohaiivirga grylli TaxID=3133970 RepID=A0ABV0BH02_9HYPH